MPFAKPSFPFGSSNAKRALMGEVSFFDGEKLLAAGEFKNEKIFGYFMMGQPTVVINDEELAKKVLVKDIIFTVHWTVFTTKTFIFDFIVI